MARRDAGNVVKGERLAAVARGLPKVSGNQATSWATVVEVSSCVRTASAVIGSPNR
jgi:hypothetical protein